MFYYSVMREKFISQNKDLMQAVDNINIDQLKKQYTLNDKQFQPLTDAIKIFSDTYDNFKISIESSDANGKATEKDLENARLTCQELKSVVDNELNKLPLLNKETIDSKNKEVILKKIETISNAIANAREKIPAELREDIRYKYVESRLVDYKKSLKKDGSKQDIITKIKFVDNETRDSILSNLQFLEKTVSEEIEWSRKRSNLNLKHLISVISGIRDKVVKAKKKYALKNTNSDNPYLEIEKALDRKEQEIKNKYDTNSNGNLYLEEKVANVLLSEIRGIESKSDREESNEILLSLRLKLSELEEKVLKSENEFEKNNQDSNQDNPFSPFLEQINNERDKLKEYDTDSGGSKFLKPDDSFASSILLIKTSYSSVIANLLVKNADDLQSSHNSLTNELNRQQEKINKLIDDKNKHISEINWSSIKSRINMVRNIMSIYADDPRIPQQYFSQQQSRLLETENDLKTYYNGSNNEEKILNEEAIKSFELTIKEIELEFKKQYQNFLDNQCSIQIPSRVSTNDSVSPYMNSHSNDESTKIIVSGHSSGTQNNRFSFGFAGEDINDYDDTETGISPQNSNEINVEQSNSGSNQDSLEEQAKNQLVDDLVAMTDNIVHRDTRIKKSKKKDEFMDALDNEKKNKLIELGSKKKLTKAVNEVAKELQDEHGKTIYGIMNEGTDQDRVKLLNKVLGYKHEDIEKIEEQSTGSILSGLLSSLSCSSNDSDDNKAVSQSGGASLKQEITRNVNWFWKKDVTASADIMNKFVNNNYMKEGSSKDAENIPFSKNDASEFFTFNII